MLLHMGKGESQDVHVLLKGFILIHYFLEFWGEGLEE